MAAGQMPLKITAVFSCPAGEGEGQLMPVMLKLRRGLNGLCGC